MRTDRLRVVWCALMLTAVFTGCSYTPYGSITNNTYNYCTPLSMEDSAAKLKASSDATQQVTPSSSQAASAASAEGSTTVVNKIGGNLSTAAGVNASIPASVIPGQ